MGFGLSARPTMQSNLRFAEAICKAICLKPKYVLDTGFEKCFAHATQRLVLRIVGGFCSCVAINLEEVST